MCLAIVFEKRRAFALLNLRWPNWLRQWQKLHPWGRPSGSWSITPSFVRRPLWKRWKRLLKCRVWKWQPGRTFRIATASRDRKKDGKRIKTNTNKVSSISQQYKDSPILMTFSALHRLAMYRHSDSSPALSCRTHPILNPPWRTQNVKFQLPTFLWKRYSHAMLQGGEGGRDPHLFGPWNLGRSTSSTAGWDHPRSAHSTVSRSCEGDDGHLFAMVCCWRRVER